VAVAANVAVQVIANEKKNVGLSGGGEAVENQQRKENKDGEMLHEGSPIVLRSGMQFAKEARPRGVQASEAG
jgi:hypothetical protein